MIAVTSTEQPNVAESFCGTRCARKVFSSHLVSNIYIFSFFYRQCYNVQLNPSQRSTLLSNPAVQHIMVPDVHPSFIMTKKKRCTNRWFHTMLSIKKTGVNEYHHEKVVKYNSYTVKICLKKPDRTEMIFECKSLLNTGHMWDYKILNFESQKAAQKVTANGLIASYGTIYH